MTDSAWIDPVWIDAALTAARPQAVGALLRHFRDLDAAEEAFQEACLRALRVWPRNGPPRDPTAWLIFVGRNAAIDTVRRQARHTPLPDESVLSDLGDAEAALAERLDDADYRDDVLRLLFICCHPDLPATQQIALALRIVCGLPVPRIARAFLVGDSAMEQRITRAKARVAGANVPFEAPDAVERAGRLGAVAAMLYLLFNEGYSAADGRQDARAPLCDEAIRLARLLLRLFPAEPEIMGLAALMLLQHARSPARFDAGGAVVLLEEQDRRRWNRAAIAEGLALIDKAMRHRRPGAYQVQAAIAALHARAERAEDTDWAQIDRLYATLERLQPSPVVTLNRAVAVAKLRDQGRPIVIFPQGTRVAPGVYKPYRIGVGVLYESLKIPIVPMALNAGVYWPRQSFLKRPGTVVVEFLPPIPPGRPRAEAMRDLEDRLEAASDRLVTAAGGPPTVRPAAEQAATVLS